MSLIPFRDLKYLKLLSRTETKNSIKDSTTLRHMLNNEIKFQPNNPFVLHPFPQIKEEQIPTTILLMSKQMDQISVRNMSLIALENFVSVNMDPLKRVLVKEAFHCQLFCMAFVRYLQQYAKNKQLTHHLDKMKLTPFVDLFAGVLEMRNQQKILKNTKAKDKDFNTYMHAIFNTLLFVASGKYIKEADEKEMIEERYLQRAIKVACLLMENCEQEDEFQAVREYLSIVSHLLIFNGMNGRPNKMLNFCLQNDQGLYYQVARQIPVPAGMIDRYTRGLYQYSFLDPQYRLNLLKLIKNLLYLNVTNNILYSHFQVLLGLIRSNVFNGVGLKKQVFDGLIQSQSKRNMAAIDELFMRIISFGIDMKDDQIQSYTLILAQSGQTKRKEQFALLYYHIYRQSKRLNPQVINFILQVYLDQNLPLQKFQLMLSKEANIIYSSNIKKLHSLVGQNKQNSQLRQLLTILIERRKEIAFKTITKKSTHTFVSEDWLAALGKNPEIYKDYLSGIVQTLCGKSLEIYPVLINLKSCIVKVSSQQYSKIQGEYWSRSLEFYSILLKSAEKFDVYDEAMFRYMILLQAIFGEKLKSDTYSYFCKNFCKIAHPQTNFLTYLQYLVRMLKNKSAMLLYLQALLEFHFHLKEIFIQKKLYDISFLVNLVQEEYFCLSTYSFQSVIVLYELSLFVKQAQFQQDYFKLIQKWSNFMSRTQCKQFQYLFSFREIKKVYPLMKQQQMKEPSDRIKMVWDTVLNLIGENRPTKQYIQMGSNKIIVNWKSQQEVAKRGIQISGIFLRNSNIQLYWDIRIQTREKTYTIAINYDRAIVEQQSRQLKQSKLVIKQTNMRQLKKHAPESIGFDMKLQSHNKKMKISLKVYDIQIIDHDFQGNIMTIKLHCKENAYLKDIKIIESFMPGETSTLNQHIIPLNRWQIKILNLNTIISQNFGTKFDFQHAFCCIGEMLRYFAFVNLPFAYDILIRLATKMIAFHKGNAFNQMQVILQIWDAIDKNFVSMKGRGKIITPVIEVQHAKIYPFPYYYLFVSSLLPKNFWLSFNEKTKKNLIKVLKQIIKLQQFRKIQNKRLLLFDQMLEISIQHQSYYEICEQILDNHEMDSILSKKFQKFLHLAHQSSYFKQLLTKYLYKNLQYLNIQQNEQYLDKRLRCKFLIVKSQKYEEQIFKLCKIQSKISLLSYHAQNLTFDSNGEPSGLYFIKKLIQLVDVSQREQVIGWLIVQIKQLMFVNEMLKKDKKKVNYEVNNVYLELLCINRSKANEEDKNNIDNLIHSMLQSLQADIKSKPQLKIQLQSAFQTTTFIHFLKEITHQIIQKYKNINVYGKKDKVLDIYTLAISVITNFQKKNFFEFMIKYRYYCSHDCKLLKALIQFQAFKDLKLAHFSVFLQYIFEILLIIEQKSNLTLEQCKQLFTSINQYIEFIINTLDEKCMPKALFYNYPRLSGSKDGLHDTNKSIRRIKRVVQSIKFLELRGGIYFKCVLIVIKLMKLNPLLNYNNLVQYFLFGPINSYNRDPLIFKAPTKMPDLLSNSSLTVRERSAAQAYIFDTAQTYKLYYNNEDYPRNAFNEQTDLSVYIPDYFLMNIAEFLNEKGQQIDSDLLQRYSNSFLRGIANYKIGRQMLLPSANNYEITKYDDVIRILQDQQKPKQRSPPSSPVMNRYARRAQSAAYEDLKPFSQKDIEPFSPPRKTGRKKTEDYSVEIMRKKIEVIDTIKTDCKNWFKSQAAKKIPTYFCDKAKDIRIIELMHTHFVLKNRLLEQNQSSNQNKQQKGVQFHMRQYAAHIKHQKKQLSGESNALLQQKKRKVKKIHPYTAEQPPVLNIVSNCLSNMTCPITLKITNNDYDIRRHNQSICMKYYLQSPQPIEQPAFDKDEQFYNGGMQIQESILIEQIKDQQDRIIEEKPYCELVTRQGSYFCQYFLEKSLILMSKKDRSVFDNNLWYLKLGTPSDSLIKAQIKVQIKPEDVIQIFYRRFNQTTNNSLQFFLKDGTSKFVTFYRRQNLASIIKPLQRIFRGIKIVKDLVKQFQQAKYTDKWVEGYLSNFDYLMLLNKYSGRTYNDLGQYYVFPWVLKDYSSQKLDLTDHDIYRDLSKPIGALNPQKLKRYMSKYRNQSSNPEKCIYGSHYSTSLFVFYYLVRLQPYSSLHRDMQKGRWDQADRLFSSIEQVWDSLYSESSTSDIKQCIPEFYYMPAFLRNIAHIQLGKKQCGSYVGDVQLPPWAKSAEEFVVTMRAALESDYVSENLHLWIDLIFGKHQNSQERFNVFHPYSYSDPEILTKFNSKNTREIQGKICQITYFGQCPIQLFKKQHKPKKSIGDIRQARSTYVIRSENTIPLQIIGEGSIPSGWTITQVWIDGSSFAIQLKNASKQQKQAAIISANANAQSLRESLQNLQDIPKNQTKIQNEVKLSVNQRYQLSIGKEFLMDLDIRFIFQRTEINQLCLACFGHKGIRIYNWQLQQYWAWENGEVREVHLQATRLIFSAPHGKLYCYSFFDRKFQEIIVFKDRQICDMIIRVIPLPRLPNRDRNQINYKVLCIGDGCRVSIANVSFQQSTNFTSLGRPS